MSQVLPDELKEGIPNLGSQKGNANPTVYLVFHFPLGGWIWFATEGEVTEEEVCFFGYVVGLEREWGYFSLSELESVDINGIRVCRDQDHYPRPLSECLEQCGLDENEWRTRFEWKHKHLPELPVLLLCQR